MNYGYRGLTFHKTISLPATIPTIIAIPPMNIIRKPFRNELPLKFEALTDPSKNNPTKVTIIEVGRAILLLKNKYGNKGTKPAIR